MTKAVEVREKLADVLQENLTDPNKNRRTRDGDFVFTDVPDTHNTFPRLIVSLLDAQKEGYGLGNFDHLNRRRIQVSIQLGKENKFDIDGDDELETAGYTKMWLAEEIDSIVQNNQNEFRGLGDDVFQLAPDSDNPTNPEGTSQVSNDYILLKNVN